MVARLGWWCCSLTALLVCGAASWAQAPSDALLARLQPSGHVNDFAGLLNQPERDALETRLKTVEEKTTAQVAVVTLTSLEGGEINDFANRLFRKWGIGLKGRNNGVLVLVAKNDRKARVEVGRGLEPVLPDVLAGRVLDDEMFPSFKKGDYPEGLRKATLRIAEILEKNEPAPPMRAAGKVKSPTDWAGAIIWFFFFGGFGGMILGAGVGSRSCWPCVVGAGLSVIGLAVMGATLGATGLAIGLSVIAVAFVLGFFAGRDQRGKWKGTTTRHAGFGDWVWASNMGSSSGGGGFDWGGSSGGFSGFGGGDSGGGGASGGW